MARARLVAFGRWVGGLGTVNRIAILACAAWAVLVLSYAAGYFGGTGGARGTAFLDAVFFLIALLLPMGLVTLAAWLAAELARQRAAVGMLAEALEPLAAALGKEGRRSPAPVPAERADAFRDLEASQRRLEAGQAELAAALDRLARRPAAKVEPAPKRVAVKPRPAGAGETGNQPALPIVTPEPEAAIAWDDLIRALDFPRDQNDREGFAALKRALRYRSLAQMLQAAEDVMNLLSQEGVYMDDLRHEPAPPEVWRAFIAGRRGSEVAAVGGIRDEAALVGVRGLMKSDPIFRDTALFFQRRFDVVLTEFASEADGEALLAIADTRSGRAFMLCARVSGSFD